MNAQKAAATKTIKTKKSVRNLGEFTLQKTGENESTGRSRVGNRKKKKKNVVGFVIIGGRCGGLMVSALDSGASTPGFFPGQGHCVVFLGKTLYSHIAPLHPGV